MYYFLSLGSNLGECRLNLTAATQLIEKKIGAVIAGSSLHESSPWGFESNNMFLNSVVAVKTELSPSELLSITQTIEKQLGRTEKTRIVKDNPIYSDRLIDIDILLAYSENTFTSIVQQSAISSQQSAVSREQSVVSYLINNSLKISTPTLTLPHPHILKREFVTRPLIEVITCIVQD